MDKTRLCKQHLAGAKRHVATARRTVDRQRGIVMALARDGHSTDRAIGLLGLFEHFLDLHIQVRERLRAELSALREPSSSRLGSGWSRDTQK
jgi:hypothetical protein